jgi:hypothetical protein
LAVTVGNHNPPQPTVSQGRAGSPVRSLAIVRPKSVERQSFLTIFGVDVGWVGVYVGVYVVVLLIVRRLLGVA